MMTKQQTNLLESINIPEDLRKLEESQLKQVSDELRDFLIDSVSKSGGHFGSGLGTIELTVALHYVYNTPEDRIVWDVGHQAYPHKILTGRKDTIQTIKKKGGLTPFPKRCESEYDTFGVGHSSTSIGAALGMALASKQLGIERKSIAVIGDGAMTAGMAFEALNHGGDIEADMLVVLNENEMSISPNVGAFSRMLVKIVSGRFYNKMRETSKRIMKRDSWLWKFMSRWEEHTKGMLIPSTLFEELGFLYFGPIDGHDVNQLVKTLQTIKETKGPKFLHIITKKGKGYKPAENDPIKYHAVSAFDPKVGVVAKQKPTLPTFTQVFGQWLCDMARDDNKLVGITPAMREGSGLVEFSKLFPKRYFDVGIAEQHAVTLAAGMACEGIRPVVAIYSSFLQRAYDQLIHDVAIQNLGVLFAIDRGGVVGPDGSTHAGSMDLSFLRCVPNMTIMAPADENECRQMLYTGYMLNSPAAVRYPRGTGSGIAIVPKMKKLTIGKAKLISKGTNIALLSFGSTLDDVKIAAQTLDATVVNMRFIKPLDLEMINQLQQKHGLIVTIEDNVVKGGAGSGVNEVLAQLKSSVNILNLGLPDSYQNHGSRDDLLQEAQIDSNGIIKRVREFMNLQKTQSKIINIK
jgi:1-deoxy-D-xylulose-5-phosphate synthase